MNIHIDTIGSYCAYQFPHSAYTFFLKCMQGGQVVRRNTQVLLSDKGTTSDGFPLRRLDFWSGSVEHFEQCCSLSPHPGV